MRKYRFWGILVVILFCCSCAAKTKKVVETASAVQPTEVTTPVATPVTTEKEKNVEKSTTIEENQETTGTTEIAKIEMTKDKNDAAQKSVVENTAQLETKTSIPAADSKTKEVKMATSSPSLPTPTTNKEAEVAASPSLRPESAPTTERATIQVPEVTPKEKGVFIAIYNGDKSILAATEISIEEKETVFEVLKKATKAQQIPLDFNGNGATAYVTGIDNLYQFDDGPESGWVYRVNGVYVSTSSGSYKVSSGDVIEWVYMKNASKQSTGN